MVVNVDEFKENPEGILSDALEYGEPVILKTGLGNFIVLPETKAEDAAVFFFQKRRQ